MARLPTPGGDDGNWGSILNEYLEVEHNSDGTHKNAEPNLGNPATDGYVLSSTTAGVRSWVEMTGGGDGGDLSAYLPKTAGSGQAITGVLYLDPGSDDSANVLRIPVTSEDGEDFNFNLGSANFGGTLDVTFNWGFNNATGGPSNSAKHAWYLQLEYDYLAGDHFVEYHLNLFGANGDFSFRPFEYKYNISGTVGSVVHRSSTEQWQSLDAVPHAMASWIVASTAALSRARFVSRISFALPDTSDALLVSSGGYNVFSIDGTVNDITYRGRVIQWQNTDASVAMYKGIDNVFKIGGSSYNGAMVNILQKNGGRGIAINKAASSPGVFMQFLENDNTVLAYINNTGNYVFQTSGKMESLAGNLELKAAGGYVQLTSVKTTTGDPTGVEGLIYWNTIDNAIKMYADGAWRTLASW